MSDPVTTTTINSTLDSSSIVLTRPSNKLDPWGGRKFVLTMLIFVVSSAMLVFNWIDKALYLSIVNSILTIFIGGNVVQKIGTSWTTSVNDFLKSKQSPPPTP